MIIIINFSFQSLVLGRKSFYLSTLSVYEFGELPARFYYHFLCIPAGFSFCDRSILLRKVMAKIQCDSYNLLHVLKDEDFCRETFLNPLFLVA